MSVERAGDDGERDVSMDWEQRARAEEQLLRDVLKWIAKGVGDVAVTARGWREERDGILSRIKALGIEPGKDVQS